MEIQIENNLLNLIEKVDSDISKVVSEALEIWLKGKVLTCPITDTFCINLDKPCNDCSIIQKRIKSQITL